MQLVEATRDHEYVRVQNALLVRTVALYDCHENLWALSRAAVRALQLNEPATMPELSRFDFFRQKEPLGPEASLQDIENWLLKG
jgi:hypothetical protein